jgi:hypothetical protein
MKKLQPAPLVPLQIRVPRDVVEKLRATAMANYRTISQEARMALDEHLQQLKRLRLGPAAAMSVPPSGRDTVRNPPAPGE